MTSHSIKYTLFLVISLILSTILSSLSCQGLANEIVLANNIPLNAQATDILTQLSGFEEQLYGHPYEDQQIALRLSRIEKTLFNTLQVGSNELRFQRIANRIKQQKEASSINSQEPLITYLEQKLFQQTYKGEPMESRVRQLETHVFGKTMEHYPMDIRLKKLTYTFPILAKEIRLTNQGRVIASTANQAKNTQMAVKAKTTIPKSIPANNTPPKVEAAVSQGHYLSNIYKYNDALFLRWSSLPVKVFFQGGNPEERDMVSKAILSWSAILPIQVISKAQSADIMIDWLNVGPSIQQALVRPVFQLDDTKKVRTVIFISLSRFQKLPLSSRQHAAVHELGHALGIWGHSYLPQDIMYPINPLEREDIPAEWNRRPVINLRANNSSESLPKWLGSSPSQRDLNTLDEIYRTQGVDLKGYSPY